MGQSNKLAQDGRALLLFPGALGDFLCWLPTALALASRFTVGARIVAGGSWLELLDEPEIDTFPIERREIAELFHGEAPLSASAAAIFDGVSAVHSWTGFGDPVLARRLQQHTEGPVFMHPFRAPQPAEHAADFYARGAGVETEEAPPARFRIDARGPRDLSRNPAHRTPWLLLHPGSGSQRKNWTGFATLARQWRQAGLGSVVALKGPAETSREDKPIPADFHLDKLGLPEVAGWLSAAPLYVGNDSGISHLAAALGTPGLALFGDTDPGNWGPRSERMRIVAAEPPCADCGPAIFCEHRLPPERVLQTALQQLECGRTFGGA